MIVHVRFIALGYKANENKISHRWRKRALLAITVWNSRGAGTRNGQPLAASHGGVSSREGETKRQYGDRNCTEHESERQKRPVKQNDDGNTPRHKYEQGDRELNIARNYYAR